MDDETWVDVFEFLNDDDCYLPKNSDKKDDIKKSINASGKICNEEIYDPVRKVECEITNPKRFHRKKKYFSKWERFVIRLLEKTTLMRKIFWKLIWEKVHV
jgi:hypothetical protein